MSGMIPMTNPNITPELERAARAVARAMIGSAAPTIGTADDVVVQPEDFDAARAVLRSLLPPSEGMVEVGLHAQCEDELTAEGIFTAMINRVLGETVDG